MEGGEQIFGVPQGFAQLHSGRASKRKAILNFSFPLEGNAAKRQRVYEVKNDNVAPLLLYAGPTLPDLAIPCRIATRGRSLRYGLGLFPKTWEAEGTGAIGT